MKGVIACCLVLGLLGCERKPVELGPNPAELQQQREAKAAFEAKEREEAAAQLKLKCVDRVAALMRTARASIKSGRAEDAVSELQSCGEHLQKTKEAVTLLETATKAKAQQWEKAQKEADRIYKARKKKEGVSIGMSQQDVLDSSWGRPERVNRTTTVRGVHEQWVYGSGNYLYFESGLLTSIQN